MPLRPVVVRSPQNNRGSNDEAYVYSNFDNLTLANRHASGRSYTPGEHYSSSEPSYHRNGGLARPAPPPYHGPHFREKGPIPRFKSKYGMSAGFTDKYPQSYTESGIQTHIKQTKQKRSHANTYRDGANRIDANKAIWEEQRRRRGL